MWQVAFSSKSVSQKTRPVRLTARRPVDERDLAEVRAPARRSRAAGGRCPRPCRAFTSTIFPPSKRTSSPETRVPAATSGAVERTTALGAPPVRAREDLLRRACSGCARCRSRSRASAHFQRDGGQEPDREVGAGAAEADRVEAVRVQRRCARLRASRRARARRRRDRAASSRVAIADGFPEPLDVRLAEDLRRPPLVRGGDDRPVEPPRADVLERRERGCSRGSDLPTSAGSRSARRSGSGLPVSAMSAGCSSPQRRTQSSTYGGDQPISSSGPSSIDARRTWRSE